MVIRFKIGIGPTRKEWFYSYTSGNIEIIEYYYIVFVDKMSSKQYGFRKTADTRILHET